MRKFLLASMLIAISLTQVGCVVPIYSSSRDDRARRINFSNQESMRHIPKNLGNRIWGLDMPDVATPYRTHGGVI